MSTYTLKAGTGQQPEDPPSGVEPDLLEDWSSYSTLSDFTSDIRSLYSDGHFSNTSQMEFVTPGLSIDGYSLTRALRYNFLASGGGPPRFAFNRSHDTLPSNGVDEMWVEFWLRIDPNYTTHWGDPGANADHKFFLWKLSGSGRFDLKLGIFDSQGLRLESPNQTDYAARDLADFVDGDPHLFQLHIKHESSDQAGDGVVEFLAGAESGGLESYHGNLSATTNRGNGNIVQLAIGGTFNEYGSITFDIWYEHMRLACWWTQDPGWSWQGGP